MLAHPTSFVAQRNGQDASIVELGQLAFNGYAHFTAMQIRGGKVRGLDLHLERLKFASIKLFGQALSDDQVRAYLRAAIEAGPSDLSLTATIYSPKGEFTVAVTNAEPEVLIRTGPAASGPEGPLTLATVNHERFLPQVKHVGEMAKTYFLRQAVEQGLDDVAFVDSRGRLSEATIWNLAFWDGNSVIWPLAEILPGTMMGTVRRQLERLGISQRVKEITLADLPALSGGVVMNSWTPGIAVSQIGSVPLPEAPAFLELLHRAYQAEPLVSP
ncbi:MAG: aminotransferase class IV family protein [Cyanobacteria bacterium P01_D01_bin.44]